MAIKLKGYKFCEMIGLRSTGIARKWEQKGLIILDPNRNVDIEKTITALSFGTEEQAGYSEKAREIFSGYAMQDSLTHKPTPITPPKATPPKQEVFSSQGEPYESPYIDNYQSERISLSDAQTKRCIVETQLKQVQLNEKIGNLIDKKTVVRIFENVFVQLKKDLLSLPRSITQQMLREKDNPQSAEKIMYDSIHDILHRNSGAKL